MQASGQGHHEREHFFGAAKVVAGMTMTSRIFGLVRDMVLVPLGGPKLADAFWTAFAIPHLFRRLFGEGALAAAFVPVFTGVAEKGGWDRARAVLANVSGILALVLAGLVVVGELGLWACGALWPGDWAHARLLQFTAIMLDCESSQSYTLETASAILLFVHIGPPFFQSFTSIRGSMSSTSGKRMEVFIWVRKNHLNPI